MLSYKNQINFVVRENILSWKRKHDDAIDVDDDDVFNKWQSLIIM